MAGTADGSPGGKGPPSGSARRVGALLQGATGVVLLALAFFTEPFERIFEQLELRELPVPTEAFLALSHILRRPAGMAVLGMLELALIVLILRGSLDRILRRWTVANAIGLTLLVPSYVLSAYLPIIRIQPGLGK